MVTPWIRIESGCSLDYVAGGDGGEAGRAGWTATRIGCEDEPVGGAPGWTGFGTTIRKAFAAGGGAVNWVLIIWLAASVPSCPHSGHWTGTGMLWLTGSTSNLYFVPQGQKTFTSITIYRFWDFRRVNHTRGLGSSNKID